MRLREFLISLIIFFSLLAITKRVVSGTAIITQNADTIKKKVDCHPLDGASEDKCLQLGCIWEPLKKPQNATSVVSDPSDPKADIQEPWCYFPNDYRGYFVNIDTGSGTEFTLQRQRPSGLPDDIGLVAVKIEEFESGLRLWIGDARKKRFEPSLPELNKKPPTSPHNRLFVIHLDQEKGTLEIVRKSTGRKVFKTNLKQLIFSDKFIQLNADLSSNIVFGLGEHLDNFVKRSDSFKAYSFFATDRLELPEGRRSYGTFPFFVNPESNLVKLANVTDDEQKATKYKHSHGVYLHNSNAMDIVLQPDASVTYRTIGGVLDFYIFQGPSGGQVVQQYQKLVGLPELPPRWALGFHLCRYNYGSLENLKRVWERTRASGIPYDVQWTDIDYMDRYNDFTYDKKAFAGLPEFVNHLHNINMHYVPIFDPGLSQEDDYPPYKMGLEMDAFVKNASDQILVGRVWNHSNRTVFPDFTSPQGKELWTKLFIEFYNNELKIDGAWIDMNEISNFVDGSLQGCPHESAIPYHPGGYDLEHKTLCLDAKHHAGSQYDLHNLNGFYENIATREALLAIKPNKRTFIISRSTSSGQGHYGGHWSGDILATWEYLRWTIPSSIEHSMYGFNMMGHDICGFSMEPSVELCARWQALGAFYTFSRNHNDDVSKDQDPVIMGEDVLEATRNSLTKRYSLLPYLYNLIYRAHRFGEPVIRSTAFEYLESETEALEAEEQFMWGTRMIISPIVYENTYDKRTYLPKGLWYELSVEPQIKGNYSSVPKAKVINSPGGWHETNNVSLRDIPIFFKGGSIIPTYKTVRRTVPETEQQFYSLEVYPKNYIHHNSTIITAFGELFIDDGESLDDKYNHLNFYFVDNRLAIRMDHNNYLNGSTKFDRVLFYNIADPIHTVMVNGRSVPFEKDHALIVNLDGASVSRSNPMKIELM